MCRQQKTPRISGGQLHCLITPHLAECSAGIGTLSATSQTGCRASSGRFPPPLLMRVDLIAHIRLYGTAYFLVSIPKKLFGFQGFVVKSSPLSLIIHSKE